MKCSVKDHVEGVKVGNLYIFWRSQNEPSLPARMKIKSNDLIENYRLGDFSNKENLFCWGDKEVKEGQTKSHGTAA